MCEKLVNLFEKNEQFMDNMKTETYDFVREQDLAL